MSDYPIRVFVAKWAVGGEVFECDARNAYDDFYALKGRTGYYKMGRDIFETMRDAIHAANGMRRAKIASLERQIAKLAAAIQASGGER